MSLFVSHLSLAWIIVSLLGALYFRLYRPVSLVLTTFLLATLPMFFAMRPPTGAADVILNR